ncbi:MAG: VanZ family protein [Longicatena sp.]
MLISTRKKLCTVSFIIAICFILIYLLLLFQYNKNFNISASLLLLIGISFFLISAVMNATAFVNKADQQRYLLLMWKFLLILYVIELILLLFFTSEFARDYVVVKGNNYAYYLRYQWLNGTNLVPFRTIMVMIQIFSNPYVSNTIAILNIFGNIAIFMPLSFFMVLLLKRMNKFWTFLYSISFILLLVELTQFFTLTGTMDIDDFILNLTGALMMYGILRLPFAKRMLNRLLGK